MSGSPWWGVLGALAVTAVALVLAWSTGDGDDHE